MTLLRYLPPLFFIGLFPLVMLLWAWADSRDYQSAWYPGRENEYSDSFILRSSALTFERCEFNPALMPAAMETRHLAVTGPFGRCSRRALGIRQKSEGELFPAPDYTRKVGPYPENCFRVSTLIIPLSLILIAYLPFWLGISYWQARRRHAKIQAALPPLSFLNTEN